MSDAQDADLENFSLPNIMGEEGEFTREIMACYDRLWAAIKRGNMPDPDLRVDSEKAEEPEVAPIPVIEQSPFTAAETPKTVCAGSQMEQVWDADWENFTHLNISVEKAEFTEEVEECNDGLSEEKTLVMSTEGPKTVCAGSETEQAWDADWENFTLPNIMGGEGKFTREVIECFERRWAKKNPITTAKGSETMCMGSGRTVNQDRSKHSVEGSVTKNKLQH